MKKSMLILIAILLFIALSIILIGLKSSAYQTKGLTETLQIHPDQVTEIKISNFFGVYKSTTDKEKIKKIMGHLELVHYKRLVNDQSTYMPMRARIIYLYDDDQSDFIVPYETEAMISHKVYKIMDGKIQESYLNQFYDSLD